MGKMPGGQPARIKRKHQQVAISTPPPRDDSVIDTGVVYSEASYLSICYLLQDESAASVQLVKESRILSRILEKLKCGTPLAVEQLSLGAIASAISWAPSDVIDTILQDGILDYCHEIVFRSSIYRNRGKDDPIAEIALDIIRDLVHLNDKVSIWVMDRFDQYFAIFSNQADPLSMKRAVARLVYALVETSPRSFVTGLPESRLSRESLQNMFSLLNSVDVETKCFIIMSGLVLESAFGSAVVPAVASWSYDVHAVIVKDILEEASKVSVLSSASSDEQIIVSEKRNLVRSKLRGICSLLEFLRDGLGDRLEDQIEKGDSIESRTFFRVSRNNIIDCVEFRAVEKLNLVSIEEQTMGTMVSVVSQLVKELIEADFRDEGEESNTPSVENACMQITLLDRQDVANILDMIGAMFDLARYFHYRFEENSGLTVETASLIRAWTGLAEILLRECLKVEFYECLASSLINYYCTGLHYLLVNGPARNVIVYETIMGVLGSIENLLTSKRSAVIDSDTPGSSDDLTMTCLEALQLSYLMGDNVVQLKTVSILIEFMKSMNENNVTVTIACGVAECGFVVFGESNANALLGAIDWQKILNELTQYLRSSVKGSKSQKSNQSEYVLGTAENIVAFIEYKLSSWI